MATKEEIRLIVKAEVDKAIKKMDKLEKQTKKTKSSFMKTALSVGALTLGFKKLVAVTERQQAAEKQLEQRLKSTGHAAGLTSKEIKNMASSLQEVTTFGDEAILEGQNLLLTFTNIGKDVFPNATEAMLNMSTAMGQDMKSSAIQLGKALNDPIQGVTALQRVGIQLSETQKEQIKNFMKTGDVASAQNIILGELEKQMGGSARAATETLGGALKQLGNLFGDLVETMGDEATPGLRALSEALGMSAKDGGLLSKAFALIGKVISSVGFILAGFIGELQMGTVQIKKFLSFNEKNTTMSARLLSSYTKHRGNMSKVFKEAIAEHKKGNSSLLNDLDAFNKGANKYTSEMAKLEKQEKDLHKKREQRTRDATNLWKTASEEQAEIDEEADARKGLLHQKEIQRQNAETENKKLKKKEEADYITALDKQVQNFMRKDLGVKAGMHQSYTSFMLSNLDKSSKAQFAVWKAFSIQQAIIDTYKAANAGYAALAGIPIVGPALGAAAAASAIAVGLQRVNMIRKTKFTKAEKGGVFTGSSAGQFVNLAENGKSEAVVPLEDEESIDKLQSALGNQGNTFNFYGCMFAGDDYPDEAAKKIDEALYRRYQDNNSLFAESIKE